MIAGLFLLLTLPFSSLQGAVPSRCADCHFANPSAPGQAHLNEWDVSPHGRNRVGCEGCHGGDSTTFEELAAHRSLLSPSNPAGPVARRQLPSTCGKCHMGPYVAFQESHHYELLKEGNWSTPICSTCHGEVAAHLLSPERLERRCRSCHPEEQGVRAEDPARARRFLETVEEVRETLGSIEVLIDHLEPESRRAEFQRQFRQVEVPLTEAVESAHSFKFEAANDRLEVAVIRSRELLGKLINP